MTITNPKRRSLFTIILVFLLTSCGPNNVQTQMTDTPVILPTTPPFLPVSASPSVMPTNTPVPSTPTLFVPTLSGEEKEHLIAQLLTQDYYCMLPCWGGIEPGVTTWSDAKAFFEQFAEIYSNTSAKMDYMGKSVYAAFFISKNKVESLGVPRFEYPLYRLLQDYGEPDEVYFYILDVLPVDTNNPYTVYMFYREKGIVAEYTGASAKGTTLSVCFMDTQGQKSKTAFLSLWPKESDKTFEDVITQYMSKFSPGYLSLSYHRLEELSAYTSQEFYEIYKLKENENYCLEIKNPNSKP